MRFTARTLVTGALAMAALLVMLTAGHAGATTPATAAPGTADFRNATTPMITGTVTMVNDQQLRVATDQGDDVTLMLDSHTLLPADLAPDMVVRVAFHTLDNGARHAERVMPIRAGETRNRELAYANEPGNGPEARVAVDENPNDDWNRDPWATRRADMNRDWHHDRWTARTASNDMNDRDRDWNRDPWVAEHVREMRAEHRDWTRDQDRNAWDTRGPMSSHRTRLEAIDATPATHDYVLATEPMVIGRVIAVNDYMISVDAEDGGRVSLQMDSRTQIPASLQRGMGVRIAYRVLQSGDYLAQRVVEDTGYTNANGTTTAYMPAEDRYGRDQAYGEPASYRNGHDENAGYSNDTESNTSANENEPAVNDGHETAAANPNDQVAANDNRRRRMPDTASPVPTMALFGLLTLAAGAVALRRRMNG